MVTLYLVTTIVHVDFIGLGKIIHSGEMCYLLSNPHNMTTNVILLWQLSESCCVQLLVKRKIIYKSVYNHKNWRITTCKFGEVEYSSANQF